MTAVDTTLGVWSQGTTLSSSSDGTTYTPIAHIQEVPDLGGKLDKIESTTLENTKSKTYIAGLTDPGDLAFKFRYDTATFTTCKGLEGKTSKFKVTYPDGSTHSFSGQPMCQMDSAKNNSLLTFTMTITPSTEITFAGPSAS